MAGPSSWIIILRTSHWQAWPDTWGKKAQKWASAAQGTGSTGAGKCSTSVARRRSLASAQAQCYNRQRYRSLNKNRRASHISSALFRQIWKFTLKPRTKAVMSHLPYIDELQDSKCLGLRRKRGGSPPLPMDFLQRVSVFWSMILFNEMNANLTILCDNRK